MFVSWVLDQAGVTCAGFPGAYCPTILNKARSAGKVVNTRSAQPGDIVMFNWDGGVVDHVGIVEKNYGSYIQTIEGNTDNGKVKTRTREWGVVAAIIRPNYGTASKPSSAATKPVQHSSSGNAIAVDGIWGPATTRMVQTVLHTYVDGIISSQYIGNKKYMTSIGDGWQWWNRHYSGSPCIKALQRRLGVTADGFIGPITIKALQRHLGVDVDGYCGKQTVSALQRNLNKGVI